jgi:DNA topoisomerase VI subunit B
MAPKAAKKDELQQKSPAEFFADNKNIAGFDNVRPLAAAIVAWLPRAIPLAE